ncbi:unnamed protein product [Didymodactylos carnosus]|uniref:FYVE-type domain-containing protein n=1 Tax=Didymodactylos carnosus TaxID=1234261 RepID=A0A813Q2H9_9BILA|nr:unnamed protein product [Didymodactylos carnosus]CAF0789283.1 unnamed protein product [Didymodactylos carnosus]CAF3541307.1 unnamed protein product [Didymodactylos carnosus]CAF3571730.1 unnamed protein product [Didymodactylos carnosus]
MDIDDALDQLEKKLSSPPQYPVNHDLSTTNTDIIFDQLQQADVSTNSINENKYSPSYTVDELLLLDSNDDNDKTNNDNKLEKLKQDILKLYAVNTILPTPISTADEHLTSDLPDVITQSSADVNDAIVEQEDINTLNNNHHDNDDIVSILDVVQNSDQILDNIQSHNERIDLLPDLTNIESKTIENDQQQSVLDHIVEQQEIHVENELTDQRVEIEDEPDLLLQTIDDSNESNILFTNQVKYNIDDTNNNQQNEDFLLPSNETEVSLINDFFSTVPDVVNQQYKDDVDLVCSQHEDILYNSNNNENMILQEFDLVKNTISDDDQMPIELENNNNNNSNYNYDNSNNSMQIPPPQYELEQIVKSDTIEKPHDIEEQVKSSNEDGFHFLEELLATLPPSSSTVTTAEEPFYHFSSEQVDKIDMLLKQIVDDHQHQELSPQAQSNELTHEEICTMDLEHRYNNNDINNIAEQVDNSCTSATISFQSDDKQNQSEITQENELSESTTDQDLHEKLLQAESEWSSLSENDRTLGQVCPQWMNDQEAAACMKCTTRFTLTRRRHHCRACGKIFCSACCSQKAKLIHLDNREDRACNDCVQTINKVEQLFTFLRQNQKPRSSVLRKRTVRKA